MSNNSYWGYLIVEELVRQGVDCFCISPGSRSTPLTLAVSRNERAKPIVHFDERGAAFFALGYAKASGKPAALICTSGTAAANYFPAIIEASAACVPLIVLTADRPPELLDCGANQAIDQVKLFGDYVRWHTTLPCPAEEVPAEFCLTTIDHAVARAMGPPAGPVQLNCTFREPLEGAFDPCLLAANPQIDAWHKNGARYTYSPRPIVSPAPEAVTRVHQTLGEVAHGVIVVGALSTAQEIEAAKGIAAFLGWPVLPDIASGLRITAKSAVTISYYDQLLLSDEFKKKFAPEAILQLGAPIVSKRLLQFIADAAPDRYVLVSPNPARHDPSHRVHLRLQSDFATFQQGISFLSWKGADKDWVARLDAASALVNKTLDEFFNTDTLSEPLIARLIPGLVPGNAVLFLGNSMPVRDLDMFGAVVDKPIRVAVNRGASGIDGNIATAAGWARATGRPVTAIVGDLAFLHDLNSLALAAKSKTPIIFVLINNNGGGIFSFLPIANESDHFEQFWGTPHSLSFANAAAQFAIGYSNVRTKSDLVQAYNLADESGKSAIIEITIDRHQNLEVHQQIQATIKEALSKSALSW